MSATLELCLRRPFVGVFQFRSQVWVSDDGAHMIVPPQMAMVFAKQLRQRDDDGRMRVYQRCSSMMWRNIVRQLPAFITTPIREALCQIHGDDLINGITPSDARAA